MEEQEELLNESIAHSIRGKRQGADRGKPPAKRCAARGAGACGRMRAQDAGSSGC